MQAPEQRCAICSFRLLILDAFFQTFCASVFSTQSIFGRAIFTAQRPIFVVENLKIGETQVLRCL
jgi:hypothetical protein